MLILPDNADPSVVLARDNECEQPHEAKHTTQRQEPLKDLLIIENLRYKITMRKQRAPNWSRYLMLAVCFIGLSAFASRATEAVPDAVHARLLRLLSPDTAEQTTIGLVETTAKTLLNEGQIDFPLSVDVDLAADAKRMSLDEALAPYDGDGPAIVIVMEVIRAKARRRVMSLKPVPSTVFLGYSGRAYAIAPDDPVASQSFAERLAPQNGSLTQAYTAPQALGAPLVFNYQYDTADIRARRAMSVNTYVIDRRARTYVASTFDASEERRFRIAYRVSRYDPKRAQIVDQYEHEADVDEFEKELFSVKLSSLLKDYAAKRDQAVHFDNPGQLRSVLLKARNANLKSVRANTFDARPLNDPRFASVVVIYTGARTLGAGFFVTPDVVMTNWHVVAEHKFVEMKMYGGRETYGTVLGKDARLDIALVRVQDRGNPVAFYTGRTIDPGQSVDAIGHPHRLEFALTRGVVSAVRNHASINLPKGAGDEVLYIQTDTPINPGNSGGPLFLDDHVIGMNTWGFNPGYAEGLAFSVHYSELLNFMNEHLPGYFVSPAGDVKQ